ncbi:MAG TPA: DUF2490 domain-containing protein [Bacteroidia bacterium]|nr:DUF2490 domain-containing protein [Bacteroidia bacterium]
MRLKRYLFLFSFSLFLTPAFSQTKDLGSWMTFSLDKGITNKFSFNFDQELRLKDNISNINLLYTNLGLSYKATKFLKVSVVYRFIDKHKGDDTYGVRSRLYTDFAFKVKPGKWSLGYRARFQEEWRQAGYHSDLGNMPEIYLRNLFKFSYKLTDHFSPYVGAELRWQLQNPRLPYANGFDRCRLFAGTDYKINDKFTAGTYFLFQKEFNVADPQTLYIIGLEFGISLD